MKDNGIKNFKSIKTKMIQSLAILVTASLIIIGGVTIYFNYDSTMELADDSMDEIGELAAEIVQMKISNFKEVIESVGKEYILFAESVPNDRVKASLEDKVSNFGYQFGDIIGTDGISDIDNKTNYSGKAFFEQALKGEICISEPDMNESGTLISYLLGPIWKDGVKGGTVERVICFAPKSGYLNQIVKEIKVSEDGTAYILNKNGVTIAHNDAEKVKNKENTIEMAKSDSSLSDLAELEKKMINGESGFGSYSYGGQSKILSYNPIPGTDGWSVAVVAPLSSFMQGTYEGIFVTVILIIIAVLLIVFIAYRLISLFTNPILVCSKRLDKLSEGDLTSAIPDIKSGDEVELLARSSKVLIEGINKMIKDIEYLLGAMADGNFDIRTRAEDSYVGDFASILRAIRVINRGLSGTIKNVAVTAEQVYSGAQQVADGAESLSQGTTEQAASIEELAATINDIFVNVEKNRDNASLASEKATSVLNEIDKSNADMKEMLKAMDDINKSSHEVEEIIKVIEDIAFQTNILSLNAAVEAARAGEEGKGFMVVANEVRELASKSSEASKDSAERVIASLKSVENGKKIAMRTAEILFKTVENVDEAVKSMHKISQACDEQYVQVKQINEGADQISSVVQTNSATSEESAAISQELSGHAEDLRNTVGRFNLRKD